MKKRINMLLMAVLLSFVLAGLTVTLFLLDEEFETNNYILISMILVSLWAFFIIPSLLLTIEWTRIYFANLNYDQTLRMSYLIGYGWGAIAVLIFILLSPITGTIWYIKTIKEITDFIKTKRKLNKNTVEQNDLFEL